MIINEKKIKQRPKSARKGKEINRFDAHDYENTIQNLLEKIDELESKLILTCKDKYNISSEKNFIENENINLKNELENENNRNIKLSNINSEFEQTINNLKINNQNIRDKADVQLKYLKNEINGRVN